MKSARAMIDTVSTVVMAFVAIAMLGMYVSDRIGPSATTGPTFVDEWQDVNAEGIWTGSRDAKVVISEFIDFQCPFCQLTAPIIDSIKTAFGEQVAVVYHHYPLAAIHPHAEAAAVASECAERAGVFENFARELLVSQDSIGARSWASFATEVGIVDVERFEECAALPPDAFPRIAKGRELGDLHGVSGTPTFWVNGEVVPYPSLFEKVRSHFQ